MAVAPAVGAALQAGVSVSTAENREPLALEERVPRPPYPATGGERRRHLQQRPPREIRAGASPAWRLGAGVVEVRIEALGPWRRRGVERAEPVPQVRAGVPQASEADLPELEIHRL